MFPYRNAAPDIRLILCVFGNSWPPAVMSESRQERVKTMPKSIWKEALRGDSLVASNVLVHRLH
jgi:hypothetical protein